MTCTRCGRCCARFSFFPRVSPDEWEVIARRVAGSRSTLLPVRVLDDTTQRYTTRVVDVDSGAADPGLAAVMFHGRPSQVLCPFYVFDASDGVFTCTIHDIKPAACLRYTCDGTWINDRRLEYCERCWVEDDPSLPAGKPCEAGRGCRDLEFRVQFFIARAPGTSDPGHARAVGQHLARVLDLQLATFREELVEAGETPDAIEQHLASLSWLKTRLAGMLARGSV